MLGVNNSQEYTPQEVVQIFDSIQAEMGGKIISIAEQLRQQGMQQGKRELAEALIEPGDDADLVERLANISREEPNTATTQNS